MDPATRTALIAVALVFCLFFGGASLVAIETADGSTGGIVLGVVSLVIVGMILLGIIGAIREPPDE